MQTEASVRVIGKVTKLKHSQTVFGEKFYEGVISVKRLSQTIDQLPFLISSDKLTQSPKELLNKVIELKGQIRERRYTDEFGIRRHKIYIWASEYEDALKNCGLNEVVITGEVGTKAFYRKTPLGRRISSFRVSVKRENGTVDFIPCVAWNGDAKWISYKKEETAITIIGRLQSREYEKEIEPNRIVTLTTYEVSCKDIKPVL